MVAENPHEKILYMLLILAGFYEISGLMNIFKRTIVILPAIILILVSCGNRPSITSHQSVLRTDTCKKDDNHTYSVYIPSHTSECELMPLVIIIDPHGSGGYAIRHFMDAAESYKFILGASNLVRNNYSGYTRAIELLIEDMKDKYPIDDEIYLAGFSGGARMVLSFARDHQLNGVLACGALAPKDHLDAINTSIYALSGRADFNFPEVADFIINETDKPSNLKIQLAGELHQWPSPKDISQALGWLYLSDMPADTKCISKSAILKDYAATVKKLVDSLLRNDQYIQIKMLCHNMLGIKDLPERHYFIETAESVDNDPALLAEISQLRKSLQFEYRIRKAYYNAFGSKDIVWWTREINDLNTRIEDSKDLTMQFALKRIKAFLGIVCYSLTNNALGTNDLNTAAKTLEIYKLVEPANPEMFHFFALYHLKTGKENLIADYIKAALESGFSDTILIKKEFPAAVWKNFLPGD